MTNKQRGLAAKRNGTQWEQILSGAALQKGIVVVTMPLGCRRVSAKKIIQIKTPFDFILIKNKQSAFLDCKSYDSDRLTYSDLTGHQVGSLYSISLQEVPAGYITYLRKINRVVFFPASILFRLAPRESIGVEQGIDLGDLGNFNLEKIFGNQ